LTDAPVREQFEQAHSAWLASCAVREADSGGRKFPEGPHPYRTCFQRDRDRVMHCSAFRRLDFKTQVFLPHEHDHFRTRMTHTLEVAQVARTLARALRLNEDLAETVALAHDLGHSPFGHDGESVLNELMADSGGFEHNRQSLRVVDYLEHPYPQFRGLNLSQAVRECLAKHETRYDRPEGGEFDRALQAPLEGQLVDLADEIAYTSADLEDALGGGWLTAEGLSRLSLWRQAWDVAQQEFPDARAIHKQIRACKAVLAMMTDDAIRVANENLAQLRRSLGREPDLDAIRRAGRKMVAFSPPLCPGIAEVQSCLMKQVYTHPLAEEKKAPGRQMIRDLFRAFSDQPALLPPRYERRIPVDGLPRVICDYIAGMTDRYCRLEHERVCAS
jgi:dGTPase